MDDLLSPHEAAKLTGVPASTIHKWVAQGRVHAGPASSARTARYAGAILVSRADVERERDYRAGVVSARRAAEIVGIAETTIVYYCKTDRLDHRRRGKLYEISLADLETFIEEHRAGDLSRRVLRECPSGDVECELPGCEVRFRPEAANWRRGYGRFCCHDHYAQDLKRRCWDGVLELPLMSATPKARRRWAGRRLGGGKGRPVTPVDAATIAEIAQLKARGYGRRGIAQRVGLSERIVRRELAKLGIREDVKEAA